MAKTTHSPEDGRERRELTVAVVFFLLSVVVLYLPRETQGQIAGGLRATILRPFILTQQALVQAQERAEDMARLQARLDSLATRVASQSVVAEENRRLRDLLGLTEGQEETFVPASVIRPGTAGSESVFLLDVGSEKGIRPGDPVVMRGGRLGLLGVVHQVRRGAAIGLDWSHPDFRASGMTEGGGVFGIVLSQRGAFREEDRLRLNGTPFHEEVVPGTLVATSGLGGVFPRGIPVGWVETLADTAAGWRKDYWLRPVVELGGATHALVVRGDTLVEGILRLFGEAGG
ncbi:rod shape-determining protein MreC [Gemmatimonadota bacterium]